MLNRNSIRLRASAYHLRIIMNIVDERFEAGNHIFSFNANKLSSGIYFISINIKSQLKEVRKVVLIK